MARAPESLFARGFAADARTERALRAGLAGREARVQRARLDVALRTLATEPASKLVFVDLDGVPEPEAAAKELLAVCAFGTALVAIGSTDTARLTRALLRQGIADYLVKPISAAAVREASATALDDAPERTHAGRVVAFTGSAGSGTSTLIVSMVRAIGAGGRTAVVVDLDPLAGTLSALLRTRPAGDLSGLLAALAPGAAGESGRAPTPAQLDGICASAGDRVSLVAYPLAGPLPAPPSPAAVHTLLEHLANRAHVVLAAGILDPGTRTEVMREADTRVLLYEPALPSIGAAVHCLALLGPAHPVTLVQCHPRTRRSALSPAQIRYALADRRPDVVIPFEPALHAASTGETRHRSPGKAYRAALREVMERVVEGPAPAAS